MVLVTVFELFNFRSRYSAKSAPERVCSHNSKSLQCASLTMAQLMLLHKKFYAYTNKTDQDSMILKFCSIVPIKPRSTNKGKKQTRPNLYAQEQINVSREEENYCEGGMNDDCELRI